MDCLRRLFNSPQYSDLKISSGDGTVYHVHKSIVCTQSEFFANACNLEPGFKESQDGVIDLTHEDPRMVEVVLTFFYHHDYYRSSEWTPLFHTQWRLELALLDSSLKDGTFSATVAAIYALPPVKNQKLREIAAKVAARNYSKLKKAKVFTKMAWEIEDISMDVAVALQDVEDAGKEARVEKVERRLVLREAPLSESV
ncbi:BTB/POZ domain containing protein [Lasiodiplodia theobromae]|uniref:BTB/POZ domain containing protein n=1 Tax=Lasiodiplodia theobromae TaxID=45133 RepID=UPI0015C2DD98|nr:BTB/POZ domain containing protein [Lasiodiplodia theobromae]KAF4541212.1 BTB/POZ domain containing protein [Lasiodiplodia theobromae]